MEKNYHIKKYTLKSIKRRELEIEIVIKLEKSFMGLFFHKLHHKNEKEEENHLCSLKACNLQL